MSPLLPPIPKPRGSAFQVHDPATGELLATLPVQAAAETLAAIQAAADAMRTLPPIETRRDWLLGIAERLHAARADFATLITREQGKPLAEAGAEVDYAARFFEVAAQHLDRLAEEPYPEPVRGMPWRQVHRPAGVAGLITPWNFPLAMVAKKLPYALAAGCASVWKPAGETPLSALALARICSDAGVPDGWLNLVMGDGPTIGRVLCKAPEVRVLSFTGSTEVGRTLARQCADHIKRLALELGGNAPFIVFADADLDAAVEGLVTSKFRCAGQTCVCANRVYVQATVLPAFRERLLDRMQTLRYGPGLEPGTDLGPLINRRAFTKVASLVSDSLRQGARLLLGGTPRVPNADWGCFYPPTLLDGVTDAMPISATETFGPVVGLASFMDEAEVLTRANSTPYGLAAYVFSADPTRLRRCADALRFGYVGTNTGGGPSAELPFGGMKHSGYGREGGADGFAEFCESQSIAGL